MAAAICSYGYQRFAGSEAPIRESSRCHLHPCRWVPRVLAPVRSSPTCNFATAVALPAGHTVNTLDVRAKSTPTCGDALCSRWRAMADAILKTLRRNSRYRVLMYADRDAYDSIMRHEDDLPSQRA
jgi:hypothetical protein